MAYIGNSPGVSSQRIVSTFTATSGQTTFTPSSGYTVGYVDVYLNGIKLLNGTDYTASNGSTVVLAEATATDDVVEVMAYIPRGLSDGYTKAEADAKYEPIDTAYTKAEADARYMDINEVIDTAQIRDGAVTAAKIAAGAAVPSQTGNSGKYLTTDGSTASWGTITAPTPAAVSDAANSSTGYFGMPTGTTAQRPGSAAAGYTRMNTTTGSLEFYDGTNWVATNLIPTINSITGTIYAGVSSTLTLSLTNASDTVDVKYYEGGTLLATDSGVTVTSGSATSTVPSAVYGQTAGDTISIQVFNQDGTPSSNSINKTVQGLPTGGTITTFGSYRVHAFTSSATFTVPSGLSITADTLVVAGGAAGGQHNSFSNYGGGGGAGGLIYDTSRSVTSGSYSVVVGAGGSGPDANDRGNNGGNSTVFGLSAIGGGGGGHQDTTNAGKSGGSGGGGSYPTYGSAPGGAGTSGQGYAGGRGDEGPNSSGGGGGAGGVGLDGDGGALPSGGPGLNMSSYFGTSYGESGWFAGGGSGIHQAGYTPGVGGQGGGGDGGNYNNSLATAGSANTGGGGGGGSSVQSGRNGGSGIVIVRYQL